MMDMTDPHVVLTGNLIDGFDLFGPTPLDDEDGYREARTQHLEDLGEERWLAPLRPLGDLAPIDGVDDRAADVEVPGTGTVHADDAYLTIVARDRPIAAFALAGAELVQAVDWLPSGRPDWAKGAVYDAAHGDTSFIQAAVTLLRSRNPHLHGGHGWPPNLHDDVRRDCARRGLVADWER